MPYLAPEPFASFPQLAHLALPNGARGVPGVRFARDAREAGREGAFNAPLYAATPPFPFPYPPRCQSCVTRTIVPGSPAHNLAAAYWAYGWCEGMLEAIRDPARGSVDRQAFLAFRFPSQVSSAPYDHEGLVRYSQHANPYAAPKWAEWYARWGLEGFKHAPRCYWPHIPAPR